MEHTAIAGAGHPLKKIITQTTSATPGTRTAHTHGLVDARGKAVIPTIAFGIPSFADNDTAVGTATGAIHVVKMDASTVTVKTGGTSVPFTLYVG